MSPPQRRANPDVAPVVSSGLALLIAGLLLLLAGDSFFPSDAATRSLWTALVGILLLLGGMVLLILRTPDPVPRPLPRAAPPMAPQAPPAPVAVAAVAAEAPEEPAVLAPAPSIAAAPVRSAAPAVRRAASLAADVDGAGPSAARSTFPTSIPGAYLQALSASSSGAADPWNESLPPIAAALPFSPGLRRGPEEASPWDESSEGSEREAPRLELELARLRARVRELEVPSRNVTAPLSVPRVSALSAAAKEPPSPPTTSSLGPRGCVACGTGLTAHAPSHLCWGCGRTLCSTCYWRFGPGPGLHRCPDCMTRAPGGSDAISGGRLTAASGAPAGAAASATRTMTR